MHASKKPWNHDLNFRVHVAALSNDFVKRVETLACKREREDVRSVLVHTTLHDADHQLQAMNLQNLQGGNVVPIYKTVTNLIMTATNPVSLAQMSDMFMAWF